MKEGAIICLQEVSRSWLSQLEPLFKQHGYEHRSAAYGNAFTGHMGNILAWPQARFQALRVETPCIADTVPWEPLQHVGLMARLWFCVSVCLWWLSCGCLRPSVYNVWSEVKRRRN